MKTTLAVLTIVVVVLGGILFLAYRADQAAGQQPVQFQRAEIPQTGISGPGGSQGNPPGAIPMQPAALIGLVASLAGAVVVCISIAILSRQKPI